MHRLLLVACSILSLQLFSTRQLAGQDLEPPSLKLPPCNGRKADQSGVADEAYSSKVLREVLISFRESRCEIGRNGGPLTTKTASRHSAQTSNYVVREYA